MNYVPLPLNKELLPSYRDHDLNQSPRVIFVDKIGSLLYTLCESRRTELRILRWFGKLFHKCDALLENASLKNSVLQLSRTHWIKIFTSLSSEQTDINDWKSHS